VFNLFSPVEGCSQPVEKKRYFLNFPTAGSLSHEQRTENQQMNNS